MAMIFITATSAGRNKQIVPLCSLAEGRKNGYAIKLIFAPLKFPYKVPLSRDDVTQKPVRIRRRSRLVSLKESCGVKKSKSTDWIFLLQQDTTRRIARNQLYV